MRPLVKGRVNQKDIVIEKFYRNSSCKSMNTSIS